MCSSDRQSKIVHLKSYGQTFDKSTQPQVCLFGPGPMSTYCAHRLAIIGSGSKHWHVHSLGLLPPRASWKRQLSHSRRSEHRYFHLQISASKYRSLYEQSSSAQIPGLDATRKRRRPRLTCKSVSSKPTTSRSISRNKSRMARWLSRPALSMPKWTVHIPAFKILARACARAGMGVGGADFLSGPTSATMAIRASVVRIWRRASCGIGDSGAGEKTENEERQSKKGATRASCAASTLEEVRPYSVDCNGAWSNRGRAQLTSPCAHESFLRRERTHTQR